ncbi:unnamed protein product [Candida verbasci]|uniref:Actin-binding protein n=1 Tax=Candida verbasci TaxID=1227364 RepID=A0A9W4TZB4_9ASCO|nr:unnamed protein product [Candida verbasci]
MEKIDLSSNSKKIVESYDKVVRGDPNTSYVVYSVDKNQTLDLLDSGSGSLEEFIENFTDGQIQFGLARVTVPGSDVSKNILLGWCPDNSPSKSRLSFANNFAEVSKVLNGYHVQITARDQDDLDVDEFLNRVCAAAGARYSTTPSSASSSTKATPVIQPTVSKSKPQVSSKPSFVPKSTGKPIPAKPTTKKIDKDGWGDEKDVEERDFDERPLENVPSAYKPTKVNIEELRKGKSDTISSTPKPNKLNNDKKEDQDEKEPKSLSERMKAYTPPSDGRLTSLPKPKVGHSVGDKYKANAGNGKPVFGAKPNFGQSKDQNKDKVLGGLSRNFGAENGKTPAQIWAEKRGKYKTVENNDNDDNDDNAPVKEDSTETHASELAKKFEQQANIEDEEEEKPAKLPVRNIPPPPKQQENDDDEEEEEEEAPARLPARSIPAPPKQPQPEEDDDDEGDEEEAPIPKLPTRNLPPAPVQTADDEDEDEDEAPIPKLPNRNLPPASKQEEKEEEEEEEGPMPSLSKPSSKSITATAEYDYEKDEDNEIGFSEGDLITDIEFTDDEWWTGKNTKGEVGLFPAAYVKLNEDDKPEQKETAAAAPSLASREEPKQKTKTATAEYDYDKDEDNEIGFKEGELIIDIEFVDDDWWSGKNPQGEIGLFPANYVSLNE